MGTQDVTQKAPRAIVTRPCEGICADFGDGPGQVVTYRVMGAIGWPTVEVSLCQDCADGYDEVRGVDSAETVAQLMEWGLLCREGAKGRAPLYRATAKLLEVTGAVSLDELRGRLMAGVEHQHSLRIDH